MLGGFLDDQEKQEELVKQIEEICGLGRNDLTRTNILKIKNKASLIAELDKIFNEFYNYLCFSKLEECIENKFAYNGGIKLYDPSGYVIGIPPPQKKGEIQSFQLDNKGNINRIDELGKHLFNKEIDIDNIVAKKLIDNDMESTEIKKSRKSNYIISLYNVIDTHSQEISVSLKDYYQRPFPMTNSNVKLGPVYWNLYQHLFTKDRNGDGYIVNKKANNPVYQLVQSGQFGIFIHIFNDSFDLSSIVPYAPDAYKNVHFGQEEYYYFEENITILRDLIFSPSIRSGCSSLETPIVFWI